MIDYSWVSAAHTTVAEKPVTAKVSPKGPKPNRAWKYLSDIEKRKIESQLVYSVKTKGVAKTLRSVACEGVFLGSEKIALSISEPTIRALAEKYGWKPRFRA